MHPLLRKLVEYCSTRQIYTFIIALIGFSVIVFLIEEYVEETEMDSENQIQSEYHEVKKNDHEIKNSDVITSSVTLSPIDCWKRESFKVIEKCIPCKDFEINAIKTEYCAPTGFYDKVNCTQSNLIVMRPCYSKKIVEQKSFTLFTLFMFMSTAVSYVAASSRKETLERNSYVRLSQTF